MRNVVASEVLMVSFLLLGLLLENLSPVYLFICSLCVWKRKQNQHMEIQRARRPWVPLCVPVLLRCEENYWIKASCNSFTALYFQLVEQRFAVMWKTKVRLSPGCSASPKEPGDLRLRPCFHQGGDVWMEGWEQREDLLLSCVEFPVWPGLLP